MWNTVSCSARIKTKLKISTSVYGPGIWIQINMNNIADQITEMWKITEIYSFPEQYLSN